MENRIIVEKFLDFEGSILTVIDELTVFYNRYKEDYTDLEIVNIEEYEWFPVIMGKAKGDMPLDTEKEIYNKMQESFKCLR